MTQLDVYVCDSASAARAVHVGHEPYDWQWAWSSPMFPPLTPGVYWRVRNLIDRGAVKGRQVSQLEWCAYVTKSQLSGYIDEWYGAEPVYGPDSTMPWLRDKLDALKEFIWALDDSGEYALVADEF